MPQLLLLLLPILTTAGEVNSRNSPSVANYDVVYPQNIYTQYKRDGEASYPEVVQYQLNIDGKDRVIHLEKTDYLTNGDFTETYYLEDGQEVTESPPIMDHCHYQGYIKEEENSAASISTCNGLSGFFKIRDQKYGIEPLQLTNNEEHIIFDFENLENDTWLCGVANSSWNIEQGLEASLLVDSHENYNISNEKKYVEMYIVADNSMFQKYEQDFQAVKQRIFTKINYMYTVYKKLNIYPILTGFEVWTQKDLVKIVPDMLATLKNFSLWRSEVLLKWKTHDHAQLLTNMDFEGPRVGLAFVGSMCSAEQSAAVIQDYTENAISVAATMAHEMGHTLGMNHDDTSCFCNSSICIMTSIVSRELPREFSSCSLSEFYNFTSKETSACLKNMPNPKDIQTSPICGNNVVELGEQCDCGTPEECINPCCNPKNCTFLGEAVCANGWCCENCIFKSAGSMCRPARRECDLADVCDGQSALCPADKYKQNGTPCKNNQGYCYKGKCPTLQDQCMAEWGKDASVAENMCFTINVRGFDYGFCREENKTIHPCAKEDMMCGKLFCSGGNNQPRSGGSVTIKFCKTSYSYTFDTGIVKSGTKCGDQKVCKNSKCVNIKEAYGLMDCSKNCTGHAVCDNELQCQCEEGWAPPDCNTTVTH